MSRERTLLTEIKCPYIKMIHFWKKVIILSKIKVLFQKIIKMINLKFNKI